MYSEGKRRMGGNTVDLYSCTAVRAYAYVRTCMYSCIVARMLYATISVSYIGSYSYTRNPTDALLLFFIHSGITITALSHEAPRAMDQ